MIDPKRVHDTLRRHQLTDGYEIVLDLERSHGAWVVDARTGKEYLDAFTCFASWPVGYNHPMLADPEFERDLLRAARHNPANSDLYTSDMATFVDAFAGRVTPSDYPYHFWVAGGALAVENGLKTAFDWKARKLGRTGFDEDVNDLVILHFKQAFHGRSGYTMSLTNTVPDKVGLFPKFDWPRVTNPFVELDAEGKICNDIEAIEKQACDEIEAAFTKHKDRIAGIVIETMQGEGGDNHFRPEFLHRLRQYADEHQALLIFDEIQTGFFGTGKPWMWQHVGVAPDVACFGKKTQVCGIYASARLDEVEDHVFKRSSRINSTWGGNLVDMVRCRRFIEIIEQENLAKNVSAMGPQTLAGLRGLAAQGEISNVRGIGTLIAFSLEDDATRRRMLKALYEKGLLALPTGVRSIRLRLPFVVTTEEVDQILQYIADCVPSKLSAVTG